MHVSSAPPCVGVADGAGVRPAPFGLQRVDELHRAHLGCAGDGAGGKARRQRGHGVGVRRETARDAAHDVHHVAIALDGGVALHGHRARRADAPEVVPPEIDQHQVLGALFGVGEEVGFERAVVGLRVAARARPGDGEQLWPARRARGVPGRARCGRALRATSPRAQTAPGLPGRPAAGHPSTGRRGTATGSPAAARGTG